MNAQLKKAALYVADGKWKSLIFMFLLFNGVIFGISELFDAVVTKYITDNSYNTYGLAMGYNILFIPLYYGILKYCMNLKSGESKFKSIFEYYANTKLMYKTMGSYAVQLFYIMLKTLLLIIPGIIARYEYAMVEYLIVKNPEIKVKEALKQSKEMMKGHKKELFSLQMSFWGWYVYLAIVMFIIALGSMLALYNIQNIEIILTIIVLIIAYSAYSILSVYTTLSAVELFNGIYNKHTQVEMTEEMSGEITEETTIDEEKSKRIEKGRKKIIKILVAILISVTILCGIAVYYVFDSGEKNNKVFEEQMNKLTESVQNSEDIDMTIYSKDELGEVEKYMKTLYQKVIDRDNKYYDDYDKLGAGNLLAPSILNSDKPDMSDSKEKLQKLRYIYDNYYIDVTEVLDSKKIKTEMATLNIDETIKPTYIDYVINDAEEYVSYMEEDKKSLSNIYDTYYNLLDFLAKNKNKWHGVGDQMYVDDDKLNEYNDLYNKVLEAEDVYYN